MRQDVRYPDRYEVDLEVGKRIKARRETLKLTQAALAQAIGITFQQVQKYENGVNRVSCSKLAEIAKFLNIGVSYFFGEHANEAVSKDGQVSTVLLEFYASFEARRIVNAWPHIGPIGRSALATVAVEMGNKSIT